MTASFLIFSTLYWENLLKVSNEIWQSYFLLIVFFSLVTLSKFLKFKSSTLKSFLANIVNKAYTFLIL